MPQDVTRVRSTLDVSKIAAIFRDTLAHRGVEFGKIQDEDDPFASLDGSPDFSAFAAHDKKVGSWAVQIHVFDERSSRRVEIHAVYHSGFSRVMGGTSNTYSKSASVKKAEAVVMGLRQADTSLTLT